MSDGSIIMTPAPLSPSFVTDAIRRALEEDLGERGDITTTAVVSDTATAKAVIRARAEGVVAGIKIAAQVFKTVDARLSVTSHIADGASVRAGDVMLEVSGPARPILSAERVALNFLGHLSGIATATAVLVAAVRDTRAKVCCTRKTTPGLRALEKYAVRCGGAINHRAGLYDAILIKDNHIAIAGGIRAAIDAAKSSASEGSKIEIEVDTLVQLKDALDAGAHIVLLDNMPPDVLKQAVEMIDGRAVAEASGSITLETVRAVAETGVDLISVGWITHSAPCLDVGLDYED